jgi:hypothetical protein
MMRGGERFTVMRVEEPAMCEDTAYVIYDILVINVAASENWRDDFIYHMTSGRTREYRFQGSLGFGGKFYTDTWRVSCYKEDETPERNKAIEQANAQLKLLREQQIAV